MMRHTMECLMAIGLLVAAAPAWAAEDAATLQRHIAGINRTAQTPEGQQVVVQRLSQDLGISARTLQAQRQQTGLGWGEILIANRIAQRTGLPFSQVVSEFRSGKGWGEIAHEHGLSVGKLVSEARASQAAVPASIAPAGSGRVRSGTRATGITTGLNRTEGSATAGTSGGPQGRGAGRGEDADAPSGAGASGQGAGRGGDLGVTFGSGASNSGVGGLGLGRGGGRR